MLPSTKEEARRQLSSLPGLARAEWGRLAQGLRRLPWYREAQRLLVCPVPGLAQIRINALVDGKELLVAGAGLKEGFYRLRRQGIPFPELAAAVSAAGLARYGQRLDVRDLPGQAVDLLVTDALAVGPDGSRLGDGQGHFDLAYAILRQAGAVDASTPVVAVGSPDQLVAEALPQDPWDVAVDGWLSPPGLVALSHGRPQPAGVLWDFLPARAIRRKRPLWQLAGPERGRSAHG
ncbi:MAG: 5-formyltetrahydrofolate cyclo-ligase [Thermodesulfobacteriota bacterium]